MSRYFINEGAFDSLDIGMTDSTVHVLRFAGDARLFVDKKRLRNGATPRALAFERNEIEARLLPRFKILAERDGERHGLAVSDIAAYFQHEGEMVYQLRRHFQQAPWAFAFTLRGPMPMRAGLDARMDALFETLRFRANA